MKISMTGMGDIYFLAGRIYQYPPLLRKCHPSQDGPWFLLMENVFDEFPIHLSEMEFNRLSAQYPELTGGDFEA